MADKSKGLMNLRPGTFRYKPELVTGENPLQYGLIAEEVEKVYPELVQYDHDQVNGVEYHELPVMLLNEVQKQQRQMKLQAQQIQELQARLARYEQPRTRRANTAKHAGAGH